MATLSCPSCRNTFTLTSAEAGDKVRCPKCRAEFAYKGDFKRKLILAGSLSGVLILLIVVVWFWGSTSGKDESGRQKTQDLILQKAKMAVKPAETK